MTLTAEEQKSLNELINSNCERSHKVAYSIMRGQGLSEEKALFSFLGDFENSELYLEGHALITFYALEGVFHVVFSYVTIPDISDRDFSIEIYNQDKSPYLTIFDGNIYGFNDLENKTEFIKKLMLKSVKENQNEIIKFLDLE